MDCRAFEEEDDEEEEDEDEEEDEEKESEEDEEKKGEEEDEEEEKEDQEEEDEEDEAEKEEEEEEQQQQQKRNGSECVGSHFQRPPPPQKICSFSLTVYIRPHISLYYIKIAHPGVRTLARQTVLCVSLANSSRTKIKQHLVCQVHQSFRLSHVLPANHHRKTNCGCFARKLGHP